VYVYNINGKLSDQIHSLHCELNNYIRKKKKRFVRIMDSIDCEKHYSKYVLGVANNYSYSFFM